MSQTRATVLALERDEYRCQWCMYRRDRLRDVHWFTTGNVLGGGHHLLGRARVDKPEAIIALCSECHSDATSNIIKQRELIQLQKERLGIDLAEQYPQFVNWK